MNIQLIEIANERLAAYNLSGPLSHLCTTRLSQPQPLSTRRLSLEYYARCSLHRTPPASAIRIRRRLFATMYVNSYAIVNMLVKKARYQVSHLVCRSFNQLLR